MYDIIVPIWMLWLLPPFVFVALAITLAVDILLFLILYKALRLNDETGESAKAMIFRSITRVWLFGFLADFIGCLPLVIIFGLGSFPKELPWQLNQAVFYNPFTNMGAFLSVLGCILLAGLVNLLFNHKIALKKVIGDSALRLKFSIWFAIFSAPWAFLIPSVWWSPRL